MYQTGASFRDNDGQTTYTPFITDDSQVGYRCVRDDGHVTHIYFNPSGGSDDGVATVFVYQGPYGKPESDAPSHYYAVWDDQGGD